jgi:hypothetical protein
VLRGFLEWLFGQQWIIRFIELLWIDELKWLVRFFGFKRLLGIERQQRIIRRC